MKLETKNAIVYDVETQKTISEVEGGWSNPGDMGMASAVTYDFATDEYDFFLGDKGRIKLLKKLHDRVVIGFNSVIFDSRVILGNDRCIVYNEDNTVLTYAGITSSDKVAGDPISFINIDLALLYVRARFAPNCPTMAVPVDLMADNNIHDGTWNLDALSKANFGLGKSGHGALAPGLWQSNRLDELLQYNFNDVNRTRGLATRMLTDGVVRDIAGRAYQIQ
jgi:hypothetical protein